jgi:hypothetical protein
MERSSAKYPHYRIPMLDSLMVVFGVLTRDQCR